MPSPDDGSTYFIQGLSASALDGEVVPPTNVSQYRWIDLFIEDSAYIGTLAFQGAYDAINNKWMDIKMYSLTSLSGYNAASTTQAYFTAFGCPVRFPWFRVTLRQYASGTAAAMLQLSREGPAGFQLISTYSLNDGVNSVAIASGTSADTIVSAVPGMLSRVLVTTQNTHQMTFYDNASAASGKIVGIILANQPVDGKYFVMRAPVANGIYVAGNANNPGVTVFYS